MMNIWHYSLPQAGLAVTPGPLLVMPTAIVTGRLASALRPSPVPGRRFAAVCLQRPVVPARARDRSAVSVALASRADDERHSGRPGAAIAVRRGREPPAGGALRRRQRGQPGHTPDRLGARCGAHGGAAGPCRHCNAPTSMRCTSCTARLRCSRGCCACLLTRSRGGHCREHDRAIRCCPAKRAGMPITLPLHRLRPSWRLNTPSKPR